MADNASRPENGSAHPRVHCRECQKEIPASQLEQPETQEYALHFCGLECFEKWQKRAEKEIATGKSRAPD